MSGVFETVVAVYIVGLVLMAPTALIALWLSGKRAKIRDDSKALRAENIRLLGDLIDRTRWGAAGWMEQKECASKLRDCMIELERISKLPRDTKISEFWP